MARFWTLLMLILLVGGLFAACGQAVAPGEVTRPLAANPEKPAALTGWEQKWETAQKEAKKEGRVVVYTITGPSVRAVLTEAFQKEHGIELEFVAGPTADIANKLVTEQERGLKMADAVIAGGGTLLTVLKPKRALASLEPFLILPEVTDTKLWLGQQLFHDKDKTGVGFMSSYMRYVFRNTDLVKAEEVTTYEDLLKPQFKGKIIMIDPTMTGATLSWASGLARNRGLEPTKEYLRQLVKQEPVLSRDVRFIYENVARGKYSIAMEARPEAMAEFLALGAPIAYARIKEISKLAPSNAAISLVSTPAHPNAAAVFVNWLLSKEGQTVASRAWGAPSARQDVPREGLPSWLFPGPDEEFFVQDEEDYLMQGKMREVNIQIFAPLMK